MGFTPSFVRELLKKGVFMAAGMTLVTPIGHPSRFNFHTQRFEEAVDAVFGGGVGAVERRRTFGLN